MSGNGSGHNGESLEQYSFDIDRGNDRFHGEGYDEAGNRESKCPALKTGTS